MNRVTSATLRAGRPDEPEKITSSISLPRTEEGRVSPITQRMASNRLDLPQPFGPITAVRPGSTKSSVGSTKDLKPESLRRVNFNCYVLVAARLVLLGEFFVQKLRQGVERDVARSLGYAVQYEGRRGVDAVAGLTVGRNLVDPVILSFVHHALVDLFLAHPRDAPQQDQSIMNPFGCLDPIFNVPFGLILEQQVNEGEILILRQAAGNFLRRTVIGPQREDAEGVVDLARVDVLGLERGEGLGVEEGADRAAGRGIFDQDDVGLGVAQGPVAGQDLVTLGAGGIVGTAKQAHIPGDCGSRDQDDHTQDDKKRFARQGRFSAGNYPMFLAEIPPPVQWAKTVWLQRLPPQHACQRVCDGEVAVAGPWVSEGRRGYFPAEAMSRRANRSSNPASAWPLTTKVGVALTAYLATASSPTLLMAASSAVLDRQRSESAGLMPACWASASSAAWTPSGEGMPNS